MAELNRDILSCWIWDPDLPPADRLRRESLPEDMARREEFAREKVGGPLRVVHHNGVDFCCNRDIQRGTPRRAVTRLADRTLIVGTILLVSAQEDQVTLFFEGSSVISVEKPNF